VEPHSLFDRPVKKRSRVYKTRYVAAFCAGMGLIAFVSGCLSLAVTHHLYLAAFLTWAVAAWLLNRMHNTQISDSGRFVLVPVTAFLTGVFVYDTTNEIVLLCTIAGTTIMATCYVRMTLPDGKGFTIVCLIIMLVGCYGFTQAIALYYGN